MDKFLSFINRLYILLAGLGLLLMYAYFINVEMPGRVVITQTVAYIVIAWLIRIVAKWLFKPIIQK